jgi:hypothetical protein
VGVYGFGGLGASGDVHCVYGKRSELFGYLRLYADLSCVLVPVRYGHSSFI